MATVPLVNKPTPAPALLVARYVYRLAPSGSPVPYPPCLQTNVDALAFTNVIVWAPAPKLVGLDAGRVVLPALLKVPEYLVLR